MKKLFLSLALAALAVLPSCKNENEPKTEDPVTPQVDTTNTRYLGTYDLSVDYEMVVDDDDYGSGSWTGTMTITADGNNKVIVTSNIEIKSGNYLDLYNTKGYVDSSGNLILETNTYTNPSGQTFDITYGKITYKEPLKFTSDMSTVVQGYDTYYEMTNTATKQK